MKKPDVEKACKKWIDEPLHKIENCFRIDNSKPIQNKGNKLTCLSISEEDISTLNSILNLEEINFHLALNEEGDRFMPIIETQDGIESKYLGMRIEKSTEIGRGFGLPFSSTNNAGGVVVPAMFPYLVSQGWKNFDTWNIKEKKLMFGEEGEKSRVHLYNTPAQLGNNSTFLNTALHSAFKVAARQNLIKEVNFHLGCDLNKIGFDQGKILDKEDGLNIKGLFQFTPVIELKVTDYRRLSLFSLMNQIREELSVAEAYGLSAIELMDILVEKVSLSSIRFKISRFSKSFSATYVWEKLKSVIELAINPENRQTEVVMSESDNSINLDELTNLSENSFIEPLEGSVYFEYVVPCPPVCPGGGGGSQL